jgi:hypothetical protein
VGDMPVLREGMARIARTLATLEEKKPIKSEN